MSFIKRIANFFGVEKIVNASYGRWRVRVKPKVVTAPPANPVPVVVETAKPIDYFLNDPTTPDLVKAVMPPAPLARPVFAVQGYVGGGHPRQSLESQAAGCVVTMTNTINYYNSKSERPIEGWSGTSCLHVLPRAGVDLNAFYDRRSLQFFFASSEKIGGSVFGSDSTDIVAHELGHGILDTFRPDMWNAASLEVGAFHEAFGDFTAMMHILLHDEVIHKMLQETGGDLRKENVVCRLAEQFGRAIFMLAGPTSGRSPTYLRCGINSFKYVDPGTLPSDPPSDNQLAAEPHSFSRIFVGAFYDIFVMMFEDIRASGVEPVEAVKQARDLLTRYVLKAVQNAPLNVKFFESMAKTILWADVTLNNRKYHDRMHQIFVDRNMLSVQLRMLSAPKCEDAEKPILRISGSFHVKLGDHLIRALSDNPLYDVEVFIPHEQVYLYDNERNLYDMVSVSQDEALSAAQDMINYLHVTGGVSNDPKTPFEIQDGKLVRSSIECGCCR